MERYVDEGTRTYSPFAAKSKVAPEFQPRSDRPSFELVTVLAPKSQVVILQAEPQRSLLDFYIQSDGVRFLIHPETWASSDIDNTDELHALPRCEPIEVSPTASTRIVLATESVNSVSAHFIKLNYPRRISRFNRRLKRKNIDTSVETTRDLALVNFEKFAYRPDTLGFAYRDGDNSWGFLVRESIPHPLREQRFLIPFFALYGGDLKRPDDLPLLVQLIAESGADPHAFVIDEIMVPLLECWAKVARERGILLESLPQNTLLEIDQNFRPRRIVHRDCDVWVDADIRKQASLEMPFAQSSNGSDMPFPREQY